MTNKKSLKLQLISLMIAAGMIVITTIFLGGCFDYWQTSRKIIAVEKDVKSNQYWTKDGWFNGWSGELTKRYETAVNEKKELVKSSDIAQWCYESANTVTGTVVRGLAIISGVIFWICSLLMITYILCIDISYWRKHRRT